jgi:uncharacterized protein DUF3800
MGPDGHGWEEIFVKLIAYVDESGVHDKTGQLKGSEQVVVAGWIAWSKDWVKFNGEWHTTLTKYGAPYFHFSEWAAASAIAREVRPPNTEFAKNPYRGWNLKHLDDFLLELAGIAGSGNKIMIGGFVNTFEFHKAKANPLTQRQNIPVDGDPYKHCLNQFFNRFAPELLAQWRYWTEPVSFIFEHSEKKEWRNAILDVFQTYQKRDPRFKELEFRQKKDPLHLPLQAADMVAYRCRQIAGKFAKQEIPEKMPELDSALFRSMFAHFESNKEAMLEAYLSGELRP